MGVCVSWMDIMTVPKMSNTELSMHESHVQAKSRLEVENRLRHKYTQLSLHSTDIMEMSYVQDNSYKESKKNVKKRQNEIYVELFDTLTIFLCIVR